MNKTVTSLLLLLATGKALAISTQDFAWEADIHTDGNKPFYRLELPAKVHESSSRTDLGDMRVFNADNQVVPHALQQLQNQTNYPPQTQAVDFYPLYRDRKENSSGSLTIERNSNGDIVRFSSNKAMAGTELEGYLLDLRQWNKPVQHIMLEWKNAQNQSFIRKLDIYTSTDLQHWQAVAHNKPLVNLMAQHKLLQDKTLDIALPAVAFVKLVFSDNKPGLAFSQVKVRYQPKSKQQQEYRWQQVNLHKSNATGEFRFDNPLKTSLHKIDIRLPEKNTVVTTRIYSRQSEQQAWQLRGNGLLYRISADGEDISQTRLSLPFHRYHDHHAQWLIRFDQQGGGIGQRTPVVKVAWQPQQLLFVARGTPPFKLLWGSYRVQPVIKQSSQLLPAGSEQHMLGQAQLQLQTLHSINPKAAIPEKKENRDWQKWLLWSSLVLAAILLILMAVSLMKKMRD